MLATAEKTPSCVTGGHVGSITVQQMSHKDYVNLVSVYVACIFLVSARVFFFFFSRDDVRHS